MLKKCKYRAMLKCPAKDTEPAEQVIFCLKHREIVDKTWCYYVCKENPKPHKGKGDAHVAL